ncbi:MAG: protein kinase domain-containing protein [Planctomycetota bacterium]|jgi:serine/threonine-protein kinase
MAQNNGAERIEFALALVGPPGSGKTETLRHLFSRLKQGARSDLISFESPDNGGTLLYDFLLLEVGAVGGREVLCELYALPGRPEYWLAERMVLQHVDGVLFVADGSNPGDASNFVAFNRLWSALGGRQSAAPFPAAMFVNKRDLAVPGMPLPLAAEAQQRGMPVVEGSATAGNGVLEALKAATAVTLRDLAGNGARRPMPTTSPLAAGGHEAAEVKQASELYLRTFAAVTTVFSPHSDEFYCEVIKRLGYATEEKLAQAREVKRASAKARLAMTLGEVLERRDVVDKAKIRMASQIKAHGEVVHEEICYGKIAIESGFTDFNQVKRAIAHQRAMDFGVALGPLLMSGGHLTRHQHREILARLAALHATELEQAAGAKAPDRPTENTTQFIKAFTGQSARKSSGMFGDLAVRYGFITADQLGEALEMQRTLRRDGVDKYLGVIMQEKGYLTDRQVEILCQSLQGELVKNPIDNYKIEAELGRGAMGLVYAARQINLDRIVALKVLDPRLAMDRQFIESFQSEARAAASLNHPNASLNHPNIVQAYDVGRSRGYFYFAMEYVDGTTVKQMIDESNGLKVDTVLDIGVQVLRALAHAEQHGMVHRDVKPANIMVTPEGVAKLCDLGLAHRGEDMDGGGLSSKIVGSPFYIAPEQIEGRSDLDSRADVYALGATLYHALVGEPPYPGRTADEIFLKHLTARVPDPTASKPEVPASVSEVIRKMMGKDREERFNTAAECLDVMKTLRRELQLEEQGGIGRSITRKIKTMILRRDD